MVANLEHQRLHLAVEFYRVGLKMSKKSSRSALTLIGVDIENECNIPLLTNAAAMFGADRAFACGDLPQERCVVGAEAVQLDSLLGKHAHILAIETGKRATDIFDFPAPRGGSTAILVGNELNGMSSGILKRADHVLSIPMYSGGLTSINVAAAAATALYLIEKDPARNRLGNPSFRPRETDLLIVSPGEPSELGSLLRSAAAFGWRRVYLSDEKKDWFTDDRSTVLAGRTAARRDTNPLAVLPAGELDISRYDLVLSCDGQKTGTPLSGFKHGGQFKKVLIIYGATDAHAAGQSQAERIYVDHVGTSVVPSFRHTGSILFAVVSHLLHREKHG